jgi:SAM-dependent methyltransferase
MENRDRLISGPREAKLKKYLEICLRLQTNFPAISQAKSLLSYSQYRYLYQLVATYVAKGNKVLDWGSGNGHFSYFLVSNGYDTNSFTIEEKPSDQMVKFLSSSTTPYQLTVVSSSPDGSMPYVAAQFDTVFSVGVLEHVEDYGGDDLKSLLEINRVLKSGGQFICYHLPNQGSYIEFINRHLSVSPTNFTHSHYYSRESIVSLCQRAGFDIITLKRYGFLPRNILNRLPSVLNGSRAVCAIVDQVDAVLERLFSPFCQNWLFVAEKRGRAGSIPPLPDGPGD